LSSGKHADQLAATGAGIPSQLVQMLPYVMTLGVLAFSATRAVAPAALGKSWPESQ